MAKSDALSKKEMDEFVEWSENITAGGQDDYVLAKVAQHTLEAFGGNGAKWLVSRSTLEDHTGLSRTSVMARIKRLREQHLIKMVRVGDMVCYLATSEGLKYAYDHSLVTMSK